MSDDRPTRTGGASQPVTTSAPVAADTAKHDSKVKLTLMATGYVKLCLSGGVPGAKASHEAFMSRARQESEATTK